MTTTNLTRLERNAEQALSDCDRAVDDARQALALALSRQLRAQKALAFVRDALADPEMFQPETPPMLAGTLRGRPPARERPSVGRASARVGAE